MPYAVAEAFFNSFSGGYSVGARHQFRTFYILIFETLMQSLLLIISYNSQFAQRSLYVSSTRKLSLSLRLIQQDK